jgi:cell division protein FtsB
MIRRTAPVPPQDALDDAGEDLQFDIEPERPVAFQPFGPGGPDLSALPIAGITQRRMAIALGALIAAWILLLVARQVGDASAATARAEVMIADNAVRHAEIAALERELDRIQQPRYILQQARAHGLGGHNEVAFTLDPDAPPLPADAPGSAALRVGASPLASPLESWMNLLFGSGA